MMDTKSWSRKCSPLREFATSAIVYQLDGDLSG